MANLNNGLKKILRRVKSEIKSVHAEKAMLEQIVDKDLKELEVDFRLKNQEKEFNPEIYRQCLISGKNAALIETLRILENLKLALKTLLTSP